MEIKTSNYHKLFTWVKASGGALSDFVASRYSSHTKSGSGTSWTAVNDKKIILNNSSMVGN